MSITEINFNAENQSLEISIQFFTDDLEKAVEGINQQRLLLGTDKENIQADSLINNYIKANFKISQNKKELSWKYIGKESERDYTFAYLELKNFDKNTAIWLSNTLLIELFDSQVNKVNFNNGDYSKSISLHKDLRDSEF